MIYLSLIFVTTLILTVMHITQCTTVTGYIKTDKVWEYVNKLCVGKSESEVSFHYELSIPKEYETQRLLLYTENQWTSRNEHCIVTEEVLQDQTADIFKLTSDNKAEAGCVQDSTNQDNIMCNKTKLLTDKTWYYVAIDNCNNQSQGIDMQYTIKLLDLNGHILDTCKSDPKKDNNWGLTVRIVTGFAVLILVVGVILFFVYKRNKIFKKQTRSHNRGTAYLSRPAKSYVISNPISIIQSQSSDSTNTNMAFTLDPDDDPAVLNVASLNEEQQPTDQAYVISTPGAFTTENPMFEYPRVQSNSVNVQPEQTRTHTDDPTDKPDTTDIKARQGYDEIAVECLNTGHESFHKDPENAVADDHEHVVDTTADVKDIKGSPQTKKPEKFTTDGVPRRLSAPESTRRVSEACQDQDQEDDNVFYD